VRRAGGRTDGRAGCVLALLVLPGILRAQEDCYPGPESNEAKTLAIFSVPLAYSPLAAPVREQPSWRLGLEVSTIPDVDDETATPTICRPGKGPENTDLLPALVRPRVVARLGAGLVLDASWVPPVRINGVKSNLFGVALGWNSAMSGSVTFGARVHGTFGEVNAPITCPEEALADPASECFEGTESDDSYKPNIFGADVRLGFGAAASKVHPYAGLGYSRLQPRFQVNFTNSAGELDNRRVIVDLNRILKLRRALADGSYRIDSRRIARAIRREAVDNPPHLGGPPRRRDRRAAERRQVHPLQPARRRAARDRRGPPRRHARPPLRGGRRVRQAVRARGHGRVRSG
jgi:hypothetical protein